MRFEIPNSTLLNYENDYCDHNIDTGITAYMHFFTALLGHVIKGHARAFWAFPINITSVERSLN